MKKTGKTTRPFRYKLNKIPYSYIVDVTNIFKGLDLIELLLEVHNIVQDVVIKIISMKKDKMLSEEVLQIAEKRREAKGKHEN